mmetsp:Transcript_3011/g.5402  ORF Transcript_3011/g.5402 Transcript_3011/m.5402 type:complete len:2910 (-) Transcript_3011:176-8905(-)
MSGLLAWGAGHRRCIVAPQILLVALLQLTASTGVQAQPLISTRAYVHIYGAPQETKVPVVVGFHTASLASYGASQRSKVRVSAASGFDLSVFQLSDVKDVMGWPEISWIEASSTQVEFHLNREPLKADTAYEITFLLKTGAVGSSMSAVTVSWFTYNGVSQQWNEEETSTENQGRGASPRHTSHFVNAAVGTATNSLAGSQVAAAWTTSSWITAFLVELRLSGTAHGVISIMPSPPSAWNFASLGSSLTDGMRCPDSAVAGVVGQAFGVRWPTSVDQCFIRKRGHFVNSIDLWFVSQDISGSAAVNLYLPQPMTGTFGSWYVAYREHRDTPGYLVDELPLSSEVQPFLSPVPFARILSTSSHFPGRRAVLQVSFKAGANMIYLANSRIELQLAAATFTIEPGGCRFKTSDSAPFGTLLVTSTAQNACTLTWSPVRRAGVGTIEVAASGEVVGTGVDFHSLGVVGLADLENAGGSSWDYLLVGSTRYIVKSRQWSSSTNQQVRVLAATATGNLRGTQTKFTTGTFEERLTVGDYVHAGGRTFVVTQVRDDTLADVQEGGIVPTTALVASSFRIRWATKLQVLDFYGNTTVLAAAAGSAFALEQLRDGAAFWSSTYSMSISGVNAATESSADCTIRVYSGKDSNSDGQLDYIAESFSGEHLQVAYPPRLENIDLHPTTVAANAKARVLLAFTTGTSMGFSNGNEEKQQKGMLLRLSSTDTAALRLHQVDGTDLINPTTEADAIDCSTWLLEVWSSASSGFPHPANCWWDSWRSAEPVVYMRLQPKNGFRSHTRYELVFLASLGITANSYESTPGLLAVEVRDGDGNTILNYGSARISRTIVPYSEQGQSDQPILSSVEVLNGDPLGSELRLRLRGGHLTGNQLDKSQRIRIFLFPLTEWSVSTCTVRRSDGVPGDTSCTVERITGRTDRNGNSLVVILSQNALPLNSSTQTVFSITGLSAPVSGLFRTEMAAEAWFNPRETVKFAASYATSANSAYKFLSSPIAEGSGSIAGFSNTLAYASDNMVLIAYRPVVTCRSTASVPCQVVVTAPLGFTVQSAGVVSTTAANSIPGTGFIRLYQAPVCNQLARTCTWQAAPGTILWAHTQYGLYMVVKNPFLPMAKDSMLNAWRVQFSGSGRYGAGLREEAPVTSLAAASLFAVRGKLRSAAVVPGSLTCAASTYFRFEFETVQAVPVGGTVRLESPLGFNFEGSGTNSSECKVLGEVNWPGGATCIAAQGVVTLSLGTALQANTFYAFALRGQLPSSASSGFFKITTAVASTELDVAERVTWSSQTDVNGDLLFPNFFECYPREIDFLQITLDDMRPHAVTLAPAVATVLFRWNTEGIAKSPVDMRVYAPPSYKWEVEATGAGLDASTVIQGAIAAPVILFPRRPVGVTRDDANILYLLTTEYLEQGLLYGFTAKVQLPVATPGTVGNLKGANSWFVVFGAGPAAQPPGRSVGELIAGSHATSIPMEIRAIHGLEVVTSTNAPLETSSITVVFSIVTALTQSGVLELALPPGYDFGKHLGKACADDGPRAAEVAAAHPSVSMLPTDANLTCEQSAPASSSSVQENVFQWKIGASGLSAGRYVVSVFVINPPPPEAPNLSPGHFVVRTFSDTSKTVAADMAAEVLAPIPSVPMPQAELLLDSQFDQSNLWDHRPSRATWLTFAFELSKDLPPDFAMQLRGPTGFQFAPTCDVHVGNGSTYSPLGSGESTAPVSAPQYALFPASTSATCTGSGQEAQIAIAPSRGATGANRLSAAVGRLYLFRVRATNPESTPKINEWIIQIANQEFSGIEGYLLWEFRDPAVMPSNTAAGEENKVTMRFTTHRKIPASTGVLRIQMPSGFQLLTAGGSAACLDFEGLFNRTILGRNKMPNVVCQRDPDSQNAILLLNKAGSSGRGSNLAVGEYEFTSRIQNSMYPLDLRNWQFASYTREPFVESTLLDSASVPGFAVNANLRSFRVEPLPTGQQSSGALATLVFKFEMTHEIATSDMILVNGPHEYDFGDKDNPGKCADFRSAILPLPACTGNRAMFSFVGVGADLLPHIVPSGSEGPTMVAFQFRVINPPVKPVNNTLEVVHCRSAEGTGNGPCPLGWQAVASVQSALWPIIPQLLSLSVVLLPPEVVAQGKTGLFTLRLQAASSGARRLRVTCEGMDFSRCSADHNQGTLATCVGQLGQAMLTLGGNYEIPAGKVFEINLRSIVNPTGPGPTTWSVTTFDAQDHMLDQTLGYTGYTISRYLALEPVNICSAELLLNPATTQPERSRCTAENPWFFHVGNVVTLRFQALPVDTSMHIGGSSGGGYQLLILPPVGYNITKTGVPFVGLEGFPATTQHSILKSSTFNMSTTIFSSELLAISLPAGLPQSVPFALKVLVDNPFQDAELNLWKVVLWEVDKGAPAYTNDGDWEGFDLKGTFESPGTLTSVQWLVSDFPSEPNVIRLRLRLKSPLQGQQLTMQVVAPEGFSFEAKCLPADADVAPPISVSRSELWVSSCTAERTARNNAVLAIQTPLKINVEYATNLLVQNAASYQASSMWQLYTFRNGDLLNFVHYTMFPTFKIQVMSASVTPEVRQYQESGFLHVTINPMRDLGPFGKVRLTAPEGFTIFCHLRPFFQRGNLPIGVSCSGANTFAAVSLSGEDYLQLGYSYHFAVRVTNPSKYMYNRYHDGRVPMWTVRLQTRDRDLVHESTQVQGYTLTEMSITRFAVSSSSLRAGAEAQVSVHFKLATELLRWRMNLIELLAPGNFRFSCAGTLAIDSFVTPAAAVLPSDVDRFQDLSSLLESPPTKGLEIYRNEGTTEDGRAIVDCSQPGRLGLAVDFTKPTAMGRYAFKVYVVNALSNPVPNVWVIRSYSDGSLLEEGATSGYDVTNSTYTLSDRLAPSTGQRLVSSAQHIGQKGGHITALFGWVLLLAAVLQS